MNNTTQELLDVTTPAQAVDFFNYPSFYKKDNEYLAVLGRKSHHKIILYSDGDCRISKWSMELSSSEWVIIRTGTEITESEFNAAMREAIVRFRPEESEQPKPRKTPEQWLDLEADVDKSHLNWNQVEALKVTQIT